MTKKPKNSKKADPAKDADGKKLPIFHKARRHPEDPPPQPEPEDDADPLDLDPPEDPSREAFKKKKWVMKEAEAAAIDLEFDFLQGRTREDVDREYRTRVYVEMGKPRVAQLATGPFAMARLCDPFRSSSGERRGESDRGGGDTALARDLTLTLSEPMPLIGPATQHAIDEMIAGLYAEFPSFKDVLQAIRESAQLNLLRGAGWFQFRPILVASPPGLGKSTFVKKLGAAAAIPTLSLDGSTIMTSVPFTGSDAVFRTSRPSDIVQHFCDHKVGNPIVVVDELDKLADVSSGGRQANPEQSLLAFLEKRTASSLRDQYLCLDIDFSLISWIFLVNDLDKISQPVRDRCKVIQIPALMPEDLAQIAAREVARRQLEPELVEPLTRACIKGQIKSLRKLHKALDAAAAVRTRTLLN